jgi:bifunctional UDP-N-acetylglucosamine pyrophosphorylase/glucosamine-1-phosphate N-acetyltransferase
MRPLTDATPKPMLPAAGRPLLEHTLDRAGEADASRFVVVGYDSEQVTDHFGDSHAGIDIAYAEQTDQRGTADAVRAAAPYLDDAPFVVLNSDALYDPESLATLYESGPAVLSFRVDNPSSYGVLQLNSDDETRVTGIVEKPSDPDSNLINTGSYVFPASATDHLDVSTSERGELELTDVLEVVCGETTVTNVPFDRWLDVGRPWELLAATEWLSESLESRLDGTVSDGATIEGRVVVEPDTAIKSGVTIEGPAYIGVGSIVGPNAYIRGATVIGSGANVGHAVEIKNTILLSDAPA